MRILGLDYGDKTVGVAVSDPLYITARGVEIIRRDNELSIKKSIARLSDLIKELEVQTIVLGYPKNMDNTESERCQKTLAFKERLERNFKKINIVLWDERLTTVQALRALREAGLKYDETERVIDKMAAVIILQSYLDSLKKTYEVNTVANDEKNDFDDFDDLDDYTPEIITLTDEDGEQVNFIIIDSAEHNGVEYLLVVDEEFADDDDADALILKNVGEQDDEVVYEFIENDDEFNLIVKLFEQKSDEYDIEI